MAWLSKLPWALRAVAWLVRKFGVAVAAVAAIDFLADTTEEFLGELAEEIGPAAAQRFLELFRTAKEHGPEGVQVPAEAYAGLRRLAGEERDADRLEDDTGAEWVNPLDETEELLARECRAWEEYERCR